MFKKYRKSSRSSNRRLGMEQMEDRIVFSCTGNLDVLGMAPGSGSLIRDTFVAQPDCGTTTTEGRTKLIRGIDLTSNDGWLASYDPFLGGNNARDVVVNQSNSFSTLQRYEVRGVTRVDFETAMGGTLSVTTRIDVSQRVASDPMEVIDRITYTPPENFTGIDSFSYDVAAHERVPQGYFSPVWSQKSAARISLVL